MIDDCDRVIFNLDSIPNNRLMKNKRSFGYIRAVRENDIERKSVETNVKSINAVTFGDLLYRTKATDAQVYLYVHNDVVLGWIIFQKIGDKLFIDVLATDKNHEGKGIGTALIRWAETWARSCRCDMIELWSIENKISWYNRLDFDLVEGTKPLKLSATETYKLMRRPILYHISPEALL